MLRACVRFAAGRDGQNNTPTGRALSGLRHHSVQLENT
jgi:hypothetical protein